MQLATATGEATWAISILVATTNSGLGSGQISIQAGSEGRKAGGGQGRFRWIGAR